MMRALLSILAVLITCFHFTLVCNASSVNQESGKTAAAITQSAVTDQAAEIEKEDTTVIQFYTWIGLLPKDFVDLQEKIGSDEYIDQLATELPALATEMTDLRAELESVKSSPNIQILQVDALHTKLSRIKNLVHKSSKPLTSAINKLSLWRDEWSEKKKQLVEFVKEEQLSLVLAIEQKEIHEKTIEDALQLIESYLKPSLVLGKAVADLQVQLHIIDSDIRELDAKVRKASTTQTAPSILSLEFYKRINAALFANAYENINDFLLKHVKSAGQNWKISLGVLFTVLLLSFAIFKSKKRISISSRWYPFSASPVATSIFALTTSLDLVTQLSVHIKLEQKWEHIFNTLTILALVRLITHCMKKSLVRELLKRLALFMAITMLLMAIELPQLLMLFFVFYASIVALIIYVYQLKHKNISWLGKFLRRTWGGLPLLVILSGVMGYDQFSINTFTTLLNSVSTCLVIWMLYMLNIGLLEIFLKMIPFSLLSDNAEVILKRLQPIIAWLHVFYLAVTLTVIWHLYTSIDTAVTAINGIGFELGGLTLSLGFLLTVVLVFYGVLLFSKAIQAILLQEVLPRYYVEKGARISITRLVHYAIVTVGFFITLKVLGFDLRQLTILGGALGIGIGFGLQAIVTNFAGGLILLFERPIKVGDTIQVGSDLGEVKNLGLRATIIQTFDNAEIVIPNSDLITGQVTNWTLAERRVRIKIPVGVAYGTDVNKVLEVLKSCAIEHPLVLSTPAPVALFLAFGASSLDFELRCWIPEFLEQLTVKSELNQAIEEEFALNNIEIPFPQSDLHLKSVTLQAASALQENTGEIVT